MIEEPQQHDLQPTAETHRQLAIAFIVGLLIGAGAVWVYFANTRDAEAPTEAETSEVEMTEEGEENAAAAASAGVGKGVEMEQEGQSYVVSPSIANNLELSVTNQPSGNHVDIGAVRFPEGGGWVVVHESDSGALGNALGAQYFTEGSWSGTVNLLRNTVVGQNYFAVLYHDNGDRQFSLGIDTPFVDGGTQQVILEPFSATAR